MRQHRIRKRFDDLTTDTSRRKLNSFSLSRIIKRQEVSDAEKIRENLEFLYNEAVSKCEIALKELLPEPSEAAFAIVEEFNDRVLRAENVQDEWRIFLRLERHRIWPEKFGLIGEGTKLREEWYSIIERIEKANKEDPLLA